MDLDETSEMDLDEADFRQNADELLEAFHTGRSLIDRFLLAIIDKHPSDDGDREKCLENARLALLGTARDGTKNRKRGQPGYNDIDLILEMLNTYVFERDLLFLGWDYKIVQDETEYGTDVIGREAKPTSTRKLAWEATSGMPEHLRHSTSERIRKKFNQILFEKDEDGKSVHRDDAIPLLMAARHNVKPSDDFDVREEICQVLIALSLTGSQCSEKEREY